MNIKVFIATPAFEGKVTLPYAVSLAETRLLLAKNHIDVEYRIVETGSLLCAERNRLIKSFIESDCTHMLCLDADLGWDANAVMALLQSRYDFCGGCYPARGMKAFFFRGAHNEDGALIQDGKGFVQMEFICAGFMILSRHCVEKIIADHPETEFAPKDGLSPSGHALFNTEVVDKEFWGEDYVFCRRARESGFKIWIHPMIQFNHAGNIGSFWELLTQNKEEAQKQNESSNV